MIIKAILDKTTTSIISSTSIIIDGNYTEAIIVPKVFEKHGNIEFYLFNTDKLVIKSYIYHVTIVSSVYFKDEGANFVNPINSYSHNFKNKAAQQVLANSA